MRDPLGRGREPSMCCFWLVRGLMIIETESGMRQHLSAASRLSSPHRSLAAARALGLSAQREILISNCAANLTRA